MHKIIPVLTTLISIFVVSLVKKPEWPYKGEKTRLWKVKKLRGPKQSHVLSAVREHEHRLNNTAEPKSLGMGF